jgi:hypothetical protein
MWCHTIIIRDWLSGGARIRYFFLYLQTTNSHNAKKKNKKEKRPVPTNWSSSWWGRDKRGERADRQE